MVIGNSLARGVAGLRQSAPADVVLALILFDYVVVVQVHDFESRVQDTVIRSNLTAIYTLLMFVGFICLSVAFSVEKRIAAYQEARRRPLCSYVRCPLQFNKTAPHSLPRMDYFLSLLLPTIQIFGSVFPFFT